MVINTFKIGEKNYTITFTMNILCQMKAAGFNVADMGDMDDDFELYRKLLFYGLQKFHKKEVKSLEVAGDIMDEYIDEHSDLSELVKILMKSLFKCLGIKVEEDNSGDEGNQIDQ